MGDGLRKRAERLFQEAVDLRGAARERLLTARCGNDPALGVEVRRLLGSFERLGGFLEPPSETGAVAIPGFEIVRLIGRGGMGTVYEARRPRSRRRVALKILDPMFAAPTWVRRFEREAEILGRLRHPGIPRMLGAGRTEVRYARHAPVRLPYLAMEYVDGASLELAATREDRERRRRLVIVARVCDAVQHAHDRGIVHRDLKPSNILVARNDRPKVLDFGIAKVDGPAWRGTAEPAPAFRSLLGTIPYMSPERLGGGAGEADASSDVYSIGVILYRLLCGRWPVDVTGCDPTEAMRRIREVRPPRPGSLDPSLGRGVDRILGRALHEEKARRYAGTAELARDIRRLLRGLGPAGRGRPSKPGRPS